jgi:hypothetical protein
MIRSILAVASGLLVAIAINAVTASLQMLPLITLAIRLVGLVFAGYVTAFISKHARITHAFTVAAVSFTVFILSVFTKSEHQNWLMWICDAFGSTIFITWGGLFRKWQVSKSSVELNKTYKPSLPRSILAIGIGFVVYMFYGYISGSISQPPAYGNQAPAFILLGWTLTQLIAGYGTAFISKRAQIAHILSMEALCLVVPVVIRMFTGIHYAWGQWIIGALTMTILMTWSGLFRILQLQKRIDSAPSKSFTSTSPAWS